MQCSAAGESGGFLGPSIWKKRVVVVGAVGHLGDVGRAAAWNEQTIERVYGGCTLSGGRPRRASAQG